MTRLFSTLTQLPATRRLVRTFSIACACLVLAACGSVKTTVDPTSGWTAERLYQDARQEISARNWSAARTRLESIEARYPFGVYAQQSLIDQAYINWKDEEPEKALAAIDRFQKQYPNHPGSDYMLYLKGLISFTPPSAALMRFTRQDPSERDPKGLTESYQAFTQLIEQYPESRYANDARLRASWLVNTIAENEVHVAEYYYSRNAYVAAINRAQRVITDFEGVPVAERALYIMYLSYDKLGKTDLRDDTKRVLDQNFPNSTYYKNGLKDKKNMWNPINWF
ncbi:outer membrane protein assembly factor BamD [Paenalcaligenes hominis]|uniref:Outer membrane protein assembly factor BamD n=1 Tax=Paenalcaligenes hominis TaxID=643674 RepID=A0ABX0WTQ7_9BURK|nr:outer membrane protein assembly factor BamD [Paenalcaligenes hominis]GGE73513.1 outer membrane protein assembly factor BamD [Paenalcaligenes hominis]